MYDRRIDWLGGGGVMRGEIGEYLRGEDGGILFVWGFNGNVGDVDKGVKGVEKKMEWGGE